MAFCLINAAHQADKSRNGVQVALPSRHMQRCRSDIVLHCCLAPQSHQQLYCLDLHTPICAPRIAVRDCRKATNMTVEDCRLLADIRLQGMSHNCMEFVLAAKEPDCVRQHSEGASTNLQSEL